MRGLARVATTSPGWMRAAAASAAGSSERAGGVGDDDGAERTAVAAPRADGAGAEAPVMTAGHDHQVGVPAREDLDDRALPVRFRRAKLARVGREGGDGQEEHGEGGAHGGDYWASLREGWVCWRKVRVGANSPSLWPTIFSVT